MTNKKTQTKGAAESSIFFPQVDRFPSRRDWEAACWKILTVSPRSIEKLATAAERHALVLRAVALSRLSDGKRPREISKELQLTRQTILALRKGLREHEYRSYRERGKTERKPFPKYRMHEDPLRRKRPKRTKYGIVYMH